MTRQILTFSVSILLTTFCLTVGCEKNKTTPGRIQNKDKNEVTKTGKVKPEANKTDTPLARDFRLLRKTGVATPEIHTTKFLYTIKPFKGIIVSYENLGYPEEKHDYSGPIFNITVRSTDGKIHIFERFKTFKGSTEDLEILKNKKECQFPTDIYNLRDTIFFD